jgi:RNA polymerase sigma-70 factor (ECF subfamily)
MSARPVSTRTDPGDAELALRAGRRDDPPSAQEAQAAFRALYDRHAGRLYSFLVARVKRSDADDALQDVWVRIWRALGEPGRFDGRDFSAWAFSIARNIVTDRARRRQMGELDGAAVEPADSRAADLDAGLIEAERKSALERCLESLKPEERAVVEARLGGDDSEETAAKLSIPPERVYKLFFNAKSKLKVCVERSGR